MKIKTVVVSILGALTLGGCANVDYSSKTPAEISQQVRIISSDFSKSDIYAAPPISRSVDWLVSYSVNLAAVRFKSSGNLTDTAYFTWRYSGNNWTFFESVTLKGAVELPVAIGQREVTGCNSSFCTYTEVISAEIPRSALQDAALSGITMRVGSQRGYVDVELPANYIQGYLIGVEGILAGMEQR